jgi:hypothetical protein
MKTSELIPSLNWPEAGATRNIVPLTITAFLIALTMTLSAVNGYWLWLAAPVAIGGVLWLFALKSTTHLLLVFAVLPSRAAFQPSPSPRMD